MKECSRCRRQQPLTAYYPRRDRASGYATECKSCSRDRRKAAALTPRRRAQLLHHAAQQRATRKDLPFQLTSGWIERRIAKGVCEVTGLPFDLQSSETAHNPFSPSLDRKNPKLGYTYANTQVVVWIYNAAKGEYTHQDVLLLAHSFICPLPHQLEKL